MNIRVLSAFAVFVAMVALFAGTVSAASVALVNPNFDDQSLSDGSQANLPSGWVAVYGTDASTNFVERNPTSAEFAGAMEMASCHLQPREAKPRSTPPQSAGEQGLMTSPYWTITKAAAVPHSPSLPCKQVRPIRKRLPLVKD